MSKNPPAPALKSFELHIRDDNVKVVVNEVEHVFQDIDKAVDFFVRSIRENGAVPKVPDNLDNISGHRFIQTDWPLR